MTTEPGQYDSHLKGLEDRVNVLTSETGNLRQATGELSGSLRALNNQVTDLRQEMRGFFVQMASRFSEIESRIASVKVDLEAKIARSQDDSDSGRAAVWKEVDQHGKLLSKIVGIGMTITTIISLAIAFMAMLAKWR